MEAGLLFLLPKYLGTPTPHQFFFGPKFCIVLSMGSSSRSRSPLPQRPPPPPPSPGHMFVNCSVVFVVLSLKYLSTRCALVLLALPLVFLFRSWPRPLAPLPAALTRSMRQFSQTTFCCGGRCERCLDQKQMAPCHRIKNRKHK